MGQKETELFENGQYSVTVMPPNINTENSISGSFENDETFVMESHEYGAGLEGRVTNTSGESNRINRNGTVAASAQTAANGTGESVTNENSAEASVQTAADDANGTGELSTASGTSENTAETSVQTAADDANGTGELSTASGTSENSAETSAQTAAADANGTGESSAGARANNTVGTSAQTATANSTIEPPLPPQITELLRGGTFYMGSPDTEEERGNDEIQYLAAVRPFFIAKNEVTQLEYQELMGTNPSYFKGPKLPVDSVSWLDAVEYCNRLSIKENLTPAYTITGTVNNRIVHWNRNANGYRLPTEEEWEYACRAGTTTSFNTGVRITRRQANYFDKGTVGVGTYAPNGWGLYDMHGNVAEWCWDRYQSYAYRQIESSMENMDNRVLRGGSWFTMTMRMRSAFRDHANPTQKNQSVGFRVARNQ